VDALMRTQWVSDDNEWAVAGQAASSAAQAQATETFPRSREAEGVYEIYDL